MLSVQLYFMNTQWFVKARNFGNYTVGISYNPANVNEIYVHTEDNYEVATVLEYQDAFKDKSYEEVLIILKAERNLTRKLKEEHLKDAVTYIAEVQRITDVKAIKTEESKGEKLKDIKLNKEAEIIMNNQVAKVVPIVAVKKDEVDNTKEIDTTVENEEQEVYESALDKFIKNKLKKSECKNSF